MRETETLQNGEVKAKVEAMDQAEILEKDKWIVAILIITTRYL